MKTPIIRHHTVDPFHMFEDFFREPNPSDLSNMPTVKADLIEKNDGYIVKVEAAGYDKKDLSIDYDEPILKITAKNVDKKESEEDHYHLREIARKSFVRTFRLAGVHEDKIEASFDNGLLSILLPKKKASEFKKVPISEGKSFLQKIGEKVSSFN